ncbi:winged helix DNA-binding protein [Erwinia sp. 9145]|uniref:winged helix DNA-binding protein n=1 Tax=Erwinia sp. 9145 TaxID=1500895 RepID=UPI0018CD986C|nr:winged helix DNA-binding protein [Erwinia sp. 9145]
MSKMKIAIMESASESEWRGSTELARRACFPASSVRVSLVALCTAGLLERRTDPNNPRHTQYRKTEKQCGFGVNANMAEFQRLISTARISHATAG